MGADGSAAGAQDLAAQQDHAAGLDIGAGATGTLRRWDVVRPLASGCRASSAARKVASGRAWAAAGGWCVGRWRVVVARS